MLDPLFSPIDGLLDFLPFWLKAATWGIALGASTMLLYGRLSSQDKIADISEESAEARRELQAYDGTDMSEVLRLAKRSLGLAFEQMKLVIGPTLIAAAPVLAAMWWMEGAWAGKEALPWGPEWLRTWHTVFLSAMTVVAFALKSLLGIK